MFPAVWKVSESIWKSLFWQIYQIQPFNVFFISQKPLRRITIEEVGGVSAQTAAESKSSIQEVVKDSGDASSPLSTSPIAKMIKIEEIPDLSNGSSTGSGASTSPSTGSSARLVQLCPAWASSVVLWFISSVSSADRTAVHRRRTPLPLRQPPPPP